MNIDIDRVKDGQLSGMRNNSRTIKKNKVVSYSTSKRTEIPERINLEEIIRDREALIRSSIGVKWLFSLHLF